VADDRLKLGTPTGTVEVAASDAWIEPRRDNFLAVIAAVAGSSGTRIAKELDNEVFEPFRLQ